MLHHLLQLSHFLSQFLVLLLQDLNAIHFPHVHSRLPPLHHWLPLLLVYLLQLQQVLDLLLFWWDLGSRVSKGFLQLQYFFLESQFFLGQLLYCFSLFEALYFERLNLEWVHTPFVEVVSLFFLDSLFLFLVESEFMRELLYFLLGFDDFSFEQKDFLFAHLYFLLQLHLLYLIRSQLGFEIRTEGSQIIVFLKQP